MIDSQLVIRSPGRINLIGEHLDYNGGYVLPAAIDKEIELSFKKNQSATYKFYSDEVKKGFSINADEVAPRQAIWENFIVGIIDQYRAMGYGKLEGFDCFIKSNLPVGAGLSSSAALMCGLAKGIDDLFSLNLSDKKLILMAQRAEHKYVGTNCGIMDQFAVVRGIENSLILLNCKTLDYEMVEANFDPYRIVLLNSNVSHSLAGSEYNTRRSQAESALMAVNEVYPGYEFLADVPENILKKNRATMDPILYKRARFVVEENQRVKMAVQKIKNGDVKAFGELMYVSHEGMRKLYEISCPELDFLVRYAHSAGHVAGARMMGGGFGGCTINLVEKQYVEAFIEEISRAYQQAYNRELTPIKVAVSAGVSSKHLK